MSARDRSRIYWRERGGDRRAYGDFRDFGDVGGGREPLVAAGQKLATTDPDVAASLLGDRLKELEARRRGHTFGGASRAATLSGFAAEHLVAKAKAGKVTDRWLASTELHLRRAVAQFGAARDLRSIGVADVRAWVDRLQETATTRGRAMDGGTVRHHLNALSNLYRRAAAEEIVPPGYNPAAALMEKPSARRVEAKWLEVPEAALLLESARRFQSARADLAIPFAYPLIATYLLTGGRRAEVLGLEVDDVSLDRRTITFRPNVHRRLKTGTSARVVPLWPQLEEILRAYLFQGGDAPAGILFPSPAGPMLTDFRKVLDRVAIAAGFWEYLLTPAGEIVKDVAGELVKRGTVRSKMFRHTYCSARLQTLDQGAPVSIYTVGKELGHGGDSLVKRVYGHLGQVRHRADVVEYRVEQHRAKLVDRLAALDRGASGTTVDTTPLPIDRKSFSRP
jgi:integrase